MFLFRPPYGDYDNDVIKTATKCGYYPIQWDVDSLDWKDYGVDSIVNTVCSNKHLGNGSIIPVSYTHLDVYKRQAVSSGLHSQALYFLLQKHSFPS